MRGRDSHSVLGAIVQAALVLLAVAVAARVVFNLLAPLLAGLIAIALVTGFAYWLLLRR